MTKKLLEDCATKEGASADDVANAVAHKMPTTNTEKCLHACIGESLGLVRIKTNHFQIGKDLVISFLTQSFFPPPNCQIQDKKTNVEASVELAKMAYGADDPRVEIARKMSTECAAVTADERCDAATKAYECTVAVAHKLGVKFEDLGL